MPDPQILGGSMPARSRLLVALLLLGCLAAALWPLRPCADPPLWNEQNCVEVPFRAGDAAVAGAGQAPETALGAMSPMVVRTAAFAGPSAIAPDAAWEGEPRNQADLVLTIVRAPAAAGVGLLRSVTLNPRDVFVSPDDRLRLAATAAQHRDEAAAAEAEFDRALQRDFAAAIAAGEARTITAGSLFDDGAVGSDAFYRVEGDSVLAVPRRVMPATAAAQRRVRQLGAALLVELAATAEELGMLTATERAQLLARAQDAQRIGPTRVPVASR